MKKTFFKTLAVVISFLMALQAIPVAAYGELANINISSSETENEQSITSESNDSSTETKEEHIYEDNNLREANTKHFRLDDGSYIAAQYPYAVHTKDETGSWQDIDNALADSGSDYATSNARIKFAKKTTGNETLFTLHDGNYKITLSLNDANKNVNGIVTNNSDSEGDTELQKMMYLEKLSSSIRYNEILDGVDLEYIVDSLNIKENIIVKEKQISYSYSFTLKLNNLSAALNDDGSISIYDPDNSETVYIIPSPVVYDASGEFADDSSAHYSLEDQGNGKFTLTVTADPEWMSADERAWPITIDPAIYVNLYNDMSDTFISTTSQTTTYGSSTHMNAGHGPVGQEYIAYWMADTLPTIPTHAYVTSAQLELHLREFKTELEINEILLGIYPVTSSWTSSQTWEKYAAGTYGQISSSILECVTVSTSNVAKYVSFDITPLVCQWFDGTQANYGVAIRQVGDEWAFARFDSTNKKSDMPCLTINYRTQTGIESYWTYVSHSAGSAGSGNVNVATGELTFVLPTLSTIDGLFGYTPSLVYNGSRATEYNVYNASTNPNCPYLYPSVGYGWRLSVNETVVTRSRINKSGATESYYVWTDGDGTEHAFYVDGSVYKDEDGLLMTLTANSTYITIEDSSHNVRHFKICTESSYIKAGAILEKITDKFGNSLVFLFDNSSNIQSNTITYGKVTKIGIKPYNSTFIPYLTLTYNGTGCITQISSVTGHKVNFTYSSTYNGTASSTTDGFLRTATFSRTSGSTTTTYVSAQYAYNSSKHLLTAKDTVGQTGVRYGINSYKISMLREQGSAIGQTAGITYGIGTTYIRTSGSDDSYGTSDDIYTYYTFDRAGRTISSYSANQDGSLIYGASTGVYDDQTTNKIKTSAVSGGSPVNYIINSNFEMSPSALLYWVKTPNVSIGISSDTFESHARIDVKASATDKIYQYVKLPNGTFTLSANIATKSCEDVTLYIKATPISSDTGFSKEIPASENAIDSEMSPNLTFEVNGDSGYVNYCISIEAVGGANVKSGAYVTVDDVMLEKGIGSSQNSVVRLGSFYPSSITSSGATNLSLTSAWARSNTSTITIGATNETQGNGAKIIGSLNKEQSLYQTVNIAPVVDSAVYEPPITSDFYMISGFAKGTHQVSSGFFGFRITVTFTDSSVMDPINIPFNNSITELQYVSGLIYIPYSQPVKSIKLECVYDNNPGTAYFDNISLVPITDGSAVDYTYNDNGKVETVKSPENQIIYLYNDNGDVVLEADINGQLVKYNYLTDSNGNITSTVSSIESGTLNFLGIRAIENIIEGDYTENINLITTHTYNAYGLVTQSSTLSPDATTNRVITSSTYDVTSGSKNFGKVLSETDENGNTNTYVYDPATGLLTYTLYPDGVSGLYYTYDDIGMITAVTPLSNNSGTVSAITTGAKAEYTYNSKYLLSDIDSATTNYSFTYDNFGNTTEIKAGDYILATYTYNSNNGKLVSMTYGNGTIVSYIYDSLDRIEKISYNGTVRYEYQYTSDGKLHSVTDLANNIGYLYDYDSEDRLLGFAEYSLDDKTNVLSVKYRYTEKNQLLQVSTSLDYTYGSGSTKTVDWHEVYDYSDETNLLTQFAIDNSIIESAYSPSSFVIDFEYDAIQRLSGKTFTIDGNTTFTNVVNYTYANRSNGTLLSSQVSGYSTQVGTGAATTYTYTYDDRGNITQIVDNADNTTKYYYDDLGQLIREDNPYKNATYIYTYDNNGNRLTKKTCTYGTEILTQTTHTYTYGDSTWGDRLTAFRGNSITYDAIGNPLSYYNGSFYTFTWADGRRLATATKGGVNYSFTYNDEGIRTSKTVGSVKHTYILDGARIVSEQWGNYFIVYLYDESGAPIGMQYRTSSMAEDVFETYYFEKNLQGDIIAVYNASGTKLVGYTYDAWGNCTTTYYNGGGSTGAQYNPFRYRGYYYDSDLGLYYLNNRYYDSIIGRFINSDSVLNGGVGLTSYNSFAYCSNNPINYTDPSGCMVDEMGLPKSKYVTETTLHGGVSAGGGGIDPYIINWGIKTSIGILIPYTINAIHNEAYPLIYTVEKIITEYVDSLVPKNHYDDDKRDVHHIVAKAAWQAEPSRNILEMSGIKINDSENLVSVKKEYHEVMHTNEYYSILNLCILAGYMYNGSNGVKKVLGTFKTVLEKK